MCHGEFRGAEVSDPDHPSDAFFLIVADLDTGMFCVEGPMSDDAPWHVAADRAQAATRSSRRVRPDRPGPRRVRQRIPAHTRCVRRVPPGSIVRPRG